jgi:hypothetical protein
MVPILASSVLARRPRPRGLLRSSLALAVGAGVVFLAGCSTSQTADVSVVAHDFYSALAAGDGDGACVALSADTRAELEKNSGKPCSEAVLDEGLPEPDAMDHARVYGTMALVPAGDGTLFLSRFPRGWLVTAAGCRLTDQAERYDCMLAGG